MGSNGCLGHFSLEIEQVPKQVKSLNDITIQKIFCSMDTTCCIDNEQQLWVFGFNNKGKLGMFSVDSHISEPVCIIPIPNDYEIEGVAEISVGFSHSIIRTIDNKVFILGELNLEGGLSSKREANFKPKKIIDITV